MFCSGIYAETYGLRESGCFIRQSDGERRMVDDNGLAVTEHPAHSAGPCGRHERRAVYCLDVDMHASFGFVVSAVPLRCRMVVQSLSR